MPSNSKPNQLKDRKRYINGKLTKKEQGKKRARAEND